MPFWRQVSKPGTICQQGISLKVFKNCFLTFKILFYDIYWNFQNNTRKIRVEKIILEKMKNCKKNKMLKNTKLKNSWDPVLIEIID